MGTRLRAPGPDVFHNISSGVSLPIFPCIPFTLWTPWIFMIIFIGLFMGVQYFYSDKMVLWTTGAQVVSEIEAPHLHG